MINRNISKNMQELLDAIKEEEFRIKVPKEEIFEVKNINEVRYVFGTELNELERKVNELVKEGYFPSKQLIHDGKNYVQCMIFSGLAQNFYQSNSTKRIIRCIKYK